MGFGIKKFKLIKALVLASPAKAVACVAKPTHEGGLRRLPLLRAAALARLKLRSDGVKRMRMGMAKLKLMGMFMGKGLLPLIIKRFAMATATAPSSTMSQLSVRTHVIAGARLTITYHFIKSQLPALPMLKPSAGILSRVGALRSSNPNAAAITSSSKIASSSMPVLRRPLMSSMPIRATSESQLKPSSAKPLLAPFARSRSTGTGVDAEVGAAGKGAAELSADDDRIKNQDADSTRTDSNDEE